MIEKVHLIIIVQQKKGAGKKYVLVTAFSQPQLLCKGNRPMWGQRISDLPTDRIPNCTTLGGLRLIHQGGKWMDKI